VVRTSSGVAIPGANLRLVETTTGRAWISWTDENGRFDLPGLPRGHYRIEVSQLGFENATQEFDLSEAAGAVNVTLKVASLQSMEAATASAQNPSQPPAAAGAPGNAGENAPGVENSGQTPGPGPGGLRRRRFPGGAASAGGGEGAPEAGQNGQNGAGGKGGAGQGTGAGGQGFGGRRGGFQQVILNNQAGAEGQGEQGQETEGGGPGDQGAAGGPLGQAASSDAFLMSGTVGQGDQNAGFGGGFPPGGMVLQGPGNAGQNGFGGTGGAFNGGAPTANPGGAGAPGLPGAGPGGPGDGPGIAFRPPGGGGRPGAGGRGAPPPGMTALYGMQRVLRQRINRVRFSLYNEYGNSVFDARPYSLTQPNAPKIPTWSERIGGNLGGPLVIPHVYNGHDKTFFFVNFDGTWARNAVDQFSTVPTPAERAGNFCDADPNLRLYIPNPANLSGPRTPVGCQIPSNAPLNPAAQGLLQFIPEPNLPGLVDNYHLQTRLPTQQDRLNARVLHLSLIHI